MSKFKDAVNQFLEIEEKSNVSDFAINNLKYYAHVRTRLFRDYIQFLDIFAARTPMSKYFELSKVIILFKSILSIIIMPFVNHRDKKIALLNPRKNGPTKEYIEDEREYFFIKMNYKANLRFTTKYLFIDLVKIVSRSISNIIGWFKLGSLSRAEEKFISLLPEGVHEKFGNLLTVFKIDFFVQYYIYRILLISFKKNKHKVIYVETAYLHFPMLKVFKEYGFTVKEVQHGVLNNYHFGYNHKYDADYFPDEMLVWGEYWRQFQIYNGISKRIIGYPKREIQINATKNSNNSLLIISQDTISKYLINEVINNFNFLRERFDKINYKLHPKEFLPYKTGKNKYYQLIKERSEQFDTFNIVKDDISIYDLMIISNVTVGVYSTALFENMKLNPESSINILKIPGYEYMEELEKYGVTFINSVKRIDIRNRNTYNSKYFFSEKSNL